MSRQGGNGRRVAEAVALISVGLLFVGVFIFVYASTNGVAPLPGREAAALPPSGFHCRDAIVVDGDTLRCGAIRVRLASIDAPEMPGHCRRGRMCTPGDPYASADNLKRLVAGRVLDCHQVDLDQYGRTIAFCAVHGHDLSCAQVGSGHAVIRYGQLTCS